MKPFQNEIEKIIRKQRDYVDDKRGRMGYEEVVQAVISAIVDFNNVINKVDDYSNDLDYLAQVLCGVCNKKSVFNQNTYDGDGYGGATLGEIIRDLNELFFAKGGTQEMLNTYC